MPKTVEEIIREEIRALSGYHVPDASGMVKLDAMENPYRLPPGVHAEFARLVEGASLNRYPDSGSVRLKSKLREVMQIPRDADIVLGNGSDEILQMLMMTVSRPGAVVLGVEPSFVMFRFIATFCSVRYVGVPLKSDFSLDVDALLAAIEQHQPPLVVIAYPNNPTANLFDASALSRVIAAAPGIVVIDEAYHAFAGHTFMPRLADFPNLVVMRTVSKLGLAGLRLGILAGARAWLQHVDKVRLPYNVNVLTQLVAEKALEHEAVLAEQAAAIRAERTRLFAELERIPGMRPFPSEANFLLFRTPAANRIFEGLRQRGVLIKNLHGSHALLDECLRVTVGTPEENTQFLRAMGEAAA